MAEKCAKFVAMFLIVAYVPIGLSLRLIEQERLYFPVGSVSNCFKAIRGLGDCGTKFYGAITLRDFQEIRPTCCQVISSVIETC